MAISSVFTNNRSQAVRIPAEMKLPDHVKRVHLRAVGSDRIISPIDKTWDSFFLGEATVSEDFMTERADQYQPERESF